MSNTSELNCEIINSVNINGIFLNIDKVIKQLKENEYLDDLILDFFIELAKETCININDNSRHKYCILSSLFNTMLNACNEDVEDYIRLRRWIKRINTPLLLNDFIVIPMHCNYASHWWLIVICYPNRIFKLREDKEEKNFNIDIENSSKGWILCMDSLGNNYINTNNKRRIILKLLKFLNVEYYSNDSYSKYIDKQDKNNLIYKIDNNQLLNEWYIVYNPKNIPYQENNFDCGVYIIEYIHWIFHYGTKILNSMINRLISNKNDEDDNLWFDKRWINNRRNIYTKVIKFISCNINWINDTYLKKTVIEMFDDNVYNYKKSIESRGDNISSSLIRKRFIMSSINRNYFNHK